MATEEVRIPDIGDAGDVEVIEVCVAAGDQVAVDDALIVIESDKASMEVPSTVAGTLVSLELKEGDRCGEGDLIAVIETSAEGRNESGGEDAEEDDSGQADSDADGSGEGDSDEEEAAGEEPEAGEDSGDDDADDETGEGSGGSRIEEVRVPDIGEAGDVEVIELLVAAGDRVEVDDGLVLLESDKATMEVPSTVAGTVASLEVKEGDGVSEGTLVARVEVEDASSGSVGEAAAADGDESGKGDKSGKSGKSDKDEDGGRDEADAGDRAASGREGAAPAPAEAGSEQPVPASRPSRDAARVYAGPAVRRLARELGVDLTRVEGSAPKGRILKEDVHAFVKSALREGGAGAATGSGIPPIPQVDFARFGEIETQPLSRIMKAGAANLHRSWLNVPHVTQHDDADVTELEKFRRSLKPEAERAGVRVTPLPFLVKAAAAALAEFPRFNGSFAGDGEHYVLKKYFHIGFAVDTPDGLLVPVIRDVDRKGVFELAEEIADLSERAREMKLRPDEMRGGCFSISSLGAIGGTGFTPIVNAPEVAILGVSRLARKPVWDGEGFVPRDMLPLSLSYDHRAINGAEAGRFLTWYAQVLGDMRRMLL